MIHIVFVGEVDSGKSTLIGKLLYDTDSISEQKKKEFFKICKDLGKECEFAYLLDSFEEERKGEFTLDTTQVYLKYKDEEYLLIDVPGHKELIKNMLTGSSYADLAVLVTDVAKPLEEQTRRHLYLLNFLGIREVIIVINKMDKVDYSHERFEKARAEIDKFCNEIDVRPLYTIPLSARFGDNLLTPSTNMEWYRGITLLDAIKKFSQQKEKQQTVRFLIQDLYHIKNEEIIVGLVASGVLKAGDSFKIAPDDFSCKVKKIVVFKERRKVAEEMENIGLILNRKSGLRRGQVLYQGRAPQISEQICAKIFCLKGLKEGDKFNFKSNFQDLNGEVIRIHRIMDAAFLNEKEGYKVETNEVAEISLSLDRKLVWESFNRIERMGRFILHKNGDVFAIGIIS